uniref:AI-2E family transporter n=1 Tax=Oscillatoriales cyanobacterium SpSt-402 TaxID=2282168 RepID=A0A832H700_9CYAN
MKLGHWIALVVLIAAVYVLWQIKEVLLMVFAAVVLANSLNLLARFLQKRLRLQRSLAVLGAVLCLLAFTIAFVWIIVPPFAQQLQELFVLVPQGINQLDNWLDSLDRAVSPDVRRYLPNFESLIQQVMPYVNRLLGSSFAVFSSSLGAALNVLLILVLGLMMLINPEPYRQGFIRLFPSFYRRRIDQILLECEVALGQWIVGALISMTVIAILSTFGLAMIGVKAALANGILAGLLNFIPNLGPTISVVPPMAIALLDSPAKALLVLGLYIAIQQFESNFLTPFVMAQQVNLLPAVTLLAQVFFATIFGFWGLLLALPLIVVCQIWIRRVLVEDVMDRWNRPPEQSSFKPVSTMESAIITETVFRPSDNISNTEETLTGE